MNQQSRLLTEPNSDGQEGHFYYRDDFSRWKGPVTKSVKPELTGRAILIGDQTSDTHVTAKLEPWQTYVAESKKFFTTEILRSFYVCTVKIRLIR